MSDTIRRILRGNTIVEVDDTQTKWQKSNWLKGKRLRPYIRMDVPYKGKFHPYGINFNFRGPRLGVKNANRSLKKGLRQQLKKELRQLTKEG
jgi:hypothetical protein